MKVRSPLGLGIALATFVILVWGVTFVNTKALLVSFSALEILFLRFVLAYAALCALCPRPLRGLSRREELVFALAGFSGATCYQFLENLAIHFTNASNVSILVSICPMFTAILSQLLLGERVLSRRFAFGFLVSMAGITLVSLNGARALSFNPVGDLLALGAGVSWGFYSVLVSRINAHGHAPVAAIRRVFFWALVTMLPLLVWGALTPDAARAVSCDVSLAPATNAARFSSPVAWLNLVFLGLFASALCFAAWNRACDLLGTVRATVGIYLIPAVTVLFAYLLLGERLTPAGALGAALTVGGVVLSGRRRRTGP